MTETILSNQARLKEYQTQLPAILSENETSARFKQILDRLVMMSERDYYNPYRRFEWPETIDDAGWWMSPELMTTFNTEFAASVSEQQLQALSKWESVNFYSLNVHGIRELLTEMIARIHTPEFAMTSEYFHHIIGEENEHMWFFATFCLRYADKVYPDRSLSFAGPEIPEAEHFLIFTRLLIFEELVDVFNQKMGNDQRLHPTIRQINAVHHEDESRHIAFGRQIVSLLFSDLRNRLTAEQLIELEAYVKGYMRASIDSLCNPAAFRDAGFSDPYGARRAVVSDPAYQEYTQRVLKRSIDHMVGAGIFSDERIPQS